MSNRKQGMFAHARYSEKVFRNLPPKIARGVERDLAYVLKKDNPIDVKKWNRALPSQSDLDNDYQTPAASSSSRGHSRPDAIPRKYVKPKPADLRNEFVSARQLHQEEYHSTDIRRPTTLRSDYYSTEERRILRTVHRSVDETILPSKNLDSYQSTRHEETPTAFRTPESKRRKVEDEGERKFPQIACPDLIASRIQSSLPNLPLRRNDATTYKDAVTEILQDAISRFMPSDSQILLGASQPREYDVDFNPNESLMNKTGPLNTPRSSLGKATERSESPLHSIQELSHMRHSFVSFDDDQEDMSPNILGGYGTNVSDDFATENEEMTFKIPCISQSFNNFNDQELDFGTPESYRINVYDDFAAKTEEMTFKIPSISQSFNNLSDQELDFGTPESSFRLEDSEQIFEF